MSGVNNYNSAVERDIEIDAISCGRLCNSLRYYWIFFIRIRITVRLVDFLESNGP